MPKADIFDEIIERLREEASTQRYASVSEPVMRDLFGEIPKARKKDPSLAKREPHPQHPAPSARPSPIPQPAMAAAKAVVPGFPAPELSSMGWDELAATVGVCRRCRLHEQRINTVFGDGSRDAELMFIGEGPGADEDAGLASSAAQANSSPG
jgi:DNA polymerase